MTQHTIDSSTREGSRHRLRRPLGAAAGLAIAAALVAAGLAVPTAAYAADDTTPQGLVAWYKLDETSGTVAADSSPSARNATVEGTVAWNGGVGFNFAGGNASAGNAIKLPNNVMTGLNSITVSADVLVDNAATATTFIYGLGNTANGTSGTGYLFTGSMPYQTKSTLTSYTAEKYVAKSTNLTKNIWKHISYTQTGTVGTLYEDGVQVGQNTAMTITPAQIGNGTTTRNYIGRSNFPGDPSFRGKVRDFRIYDRALSTAEVAAVSDQATAADLAQAASAVALTPSASVTANVAVPTTVVGANVAWTSSKPYVMSSTGKVIRPSENKNEDVTLTATVSLRGQSVTKTFDFTVLADPSSDGKAEYDAANLTVDGLDAVTGNVVLPTTTGTFGSTVAWESSNPAVLDATGTVTRPAFGSGDVDLTLTATTTNGTSSATKAFPVTVRELDRTGESAAPTTTTTVTLGASTVPFGTGTTATAKVAASDAGEIAGDVTFTAGSFTQTVRVVDGGATVDLPSTLALGSIPVEASYSGYKQIVASRGTATLTVADVIAPVTLATVVAKARTVTLVATDTQSAVARIEYRIGTTGDFTTYTAPIVVGSAATLVQFRAVDAAGNTEATNELTVPDHAESLVATTTTVVAMTDAVRYGTSGSLTVRVGGNGSAPTGLVRIISGDSLLGSAELANGRATIELSKTAAVKAHDLVVLYSGDADYAASEASAAYSVSKVTSKAKITLSKSTIKATSRAKATIKITGSNGITAVGKVTVRVTYLGKTLKKSTAALSSTGVAKVTLPKLKARTYKVTVSFAGSSTVGASSAKAVLKVKK